MKRPPSLAALVVGIILPTSPQQVSQNVTESYALSQCALVQVGATPRLFVARPDSALEALDLTSGRLLWRTKEAAFPIVARGDRLLALMSSLTGAPGWRLAVLDAASGKVFVRLPPWGQGAGTVEEGMGTRTTMEAVSRDGRDLVVWRSWMQWISGAVHKTPLPGRTETGAAEVDLIRGTLVPLAQQIPAADTTYRVLQPAGYELGPYHVDGLSLVAAREYRGGAFHLVLHRRRGETVLPDLELCEPSRTSEHVGVSEDRRTVLASCQDSQRSQTYNYGLRIYSAMSGAKVAAFPSEAWPARSIVWQNRFAYVVPDRLVVLELATGHKLVERSLRSLAYRGPYPPAARPSRP